jgi:hypothetical protein
VEKYGTARQTTDDNIIRRMRFACWITKATHTHTHTHTQNMQYLSLFHCNSGYANALQCYVIHETHPLVRSNIKMDIVECWNSLKLLPSTDNLSARAEGNLHTYVRDTCGHGNKDSSRARRCSGTRCVFIMHIALRLFYVNARIHSRNTISLLTYFICDNESWRRNKPR